MRIQVLGPVRVSDLSGAGLPVRGRAAELLAVLVARRGRDVAAAELLDLVWGEAALGLAVSVVHTTVARLRRAVGGDVVTSVDGGYRVSSAALVDAEEFQALLRQARLSSDRAPELLGSALALWTSDTAYDGLPDELVGHDRSQLELARAAAEEDLAEALVASPEAGSWAEAERLCDELIRRHPLRERAHSLRMLALYRSGRQAEALEGYRSLVALLREELGVDPGPASIEVHRQILAHDLPPLAGREGGTRTTRRQRRAHQPPAPMTPTLGRDRELAVLSETLDAGWRLVTLVGPGGVGKSRLLAEIGARIAAGGQVHYLDLAGLGEVGPEELVEHVGRSLGFAVPAQDPVGWLAASMSASSVTVLVDEAEWALAAVGSVLERLLPACPGVRAVVTSREPLDIAGERVVPVAPLALPPAGATPEEVFASPAVRLLVDRVGDLAREVPQQRTEAATLAQVVAAVDGVPLALELLASQAALRTWPEVVALLDQPLALHDPHGGPGRHRSLRETVVWSVDHLDEPSRAVLRRLAVFRGGFDLPAARAVVGPLPVEVDRVLHELVRRALVQVERGDGELRYRLLRTMADLAREYLQESGDGPQTRARHRRWFAGRWRDAPLSDDLVEDVAMRYDDYLAALGDALTSRDGPALGDLGVTLARFWLFTEQVGVGMRWTGRALESGLLDELGRARLVVIRGLVEMQFFRPELAAELAAAHDTLERHRDAEWVGMSRIGQLLERYLSGELDAAAAQARALVGLSRAHVPTLLPEALAFQAAVEVSCGLTDSALAAADEAWELARSDGSLTTLVSVAGKLSAAFTEMDQPQRALDVLGVAEAAYQQGIWQGPWLEATINAGWATLGAGDPAGALTRFARALGDLPPGASDVMSAECYLGAACALARLGHPRAPWALSAVAEVRHEAQHVLSPWQVGLLADVRARLPDDPPELGGDARRDLATRLGTLVRAAATELAGV